MNTCEKLKKFLETGDWSLIDPAWKKVKGKWVRDKPAYPKIGRSQLCPCGSGIKFKNCHNGQDANLYYWMHEGKELKYTD